MSEHSRTVSSGRDEANVSLELTPEAIARLIELRERVEARLVTEVARPREIEQGFTGDEAS